MNAAREDRHEAAARQAREDLKRLEQQSEKVFGAHATVKDAPDDGDSIERWGKRIGLALSLVMGVYVVWWFWNQIFN